jgi:hypothetical protein
MGGDKQTVFGVLLHQKFWVFPLLVAAGIALGMVKISTYQRAAAFSADGVKVSGEVTRLHEGQHRKRNIYDVSYTFASQADPYTHGQQEVSEALFDSLTEGGPIDVLYLPTAPEQNVVELGKLTSLFWLTLICASGLIFTGLLGGWLTVKRARAMVLASKASGT